MFHFVSSHWTKAKTTTTQTQKKGEKLFSSNFSPVSIFNCITNTQSSSQKTIKLKRKSIYVTDNKWLKLKSKAKHNQIKLITVSRLSSYFKIIMCAITFQLFFCFKNLRTILYTFIIELQVFWRFFFLKMKNRTHCF